MRKGLFGFAVAITTLALTPAAASAATITVDSNLDDGTNCTLREAIFSANNNDALLNGCNDGTGASDDIEFAAAQFPPGDPVETIDLGASGQLAITSNINIEGPGFDELDIDAPTNGRHFLIDPGNTVNMSGINLINANVTMDDLFEGGAIRNQGILDLDDVIVFNNKITVNGTGTTAFADGGGIWNSGNLTIDHSVVSGNSATANNTENTTDDAAARGGGIYSESGAGGVYIDHSAIDDNVAKATDTMMDSSASAEGGGVRINLGSFGADHSSFVGNVVNATVGTAGSAVSAIGGGILSSGAELELVTVAQNVTDATGEPSPENSGAGLFTQAGSSFVISSTIAQNGPDSGAADGSNLFTTGMVTFANTILASPVGGGSNCLGTVNSSGYNIDFDTTPLMTCDATPDATDLTSNPMLDVANLGLNGGFAADYPLLPGSPAIDSGTDMFQLADPGPMSHDQRDLPRPSDFPAISNLEDGSDRGSVEEQFTAPTPPGVVPPPPVVTGPTGLRSAALKQCAKIKNKKKKKKCKKRARKLPV